MQVTTAQLNQVAALLNTTDKSLVITVTLRTLIGAGMAVDAAVDAVLGAGAYRKLAGDVYHALRAQQGL